MLSIATRLKRFRDRLQQVLSVTDKPAPSPWPKIASVVDIGGGSEFKFEGSTGLGRSRFRVSRFHGLG